VAQAAADSISNKPAALTQSCSCKKSAIIIGLVLKLDRQYFRYSKSSQAGPETELRRSMNAAYSRLGLAAGARSKLNRMTAICIWMHLVVRPVKP
jgi:hypothetical protein